MQLIKITILWILLHSNLFAMNCGEPTTAIHDIQGIGEKSLLVDQLVSVEAVVTASFQGSEKLNGFFVQATEEEQDEDETTSEALFIQDGDFGQNVDIGDKLRISGTVKESFGLTQLRSITQIIHCGREEVPEARKISFPVSKQELESVEGMKVKLDKLAISDVYNLGRFGEVLLSHSRPLVQATQKKRPGDKALAWAKNQLTHTILLDDDNNKQNRDPNAYGVNSENSIRVGDQVEDLVGILSYAFGKYRIRPLNFELKQKNLRPGLMERKGLRIASFNLGNYFNGDGQGAGFPTSRGADSQDEYLRQRAKILTALHGLDAQVIGLQEIENDGFGPFSSIVDLATGLSEQSGKTYKAVKLQADSLGGDAISVGLLYDTSAVETNGQASTLQLAPFDSGNRPPLAQSFSSRHGLVFTVAVNHFKSKSCRGAKGLNKDQKDGQACWNELRLAAATELVNWLHRYPTGVETDHIIILGDLNSYAKEDPIRKLAAMGYKSAVKKTDYSYSFSARRGSLDYVLPSKSLRNMIAHAGVWHINADEARILDYNTEFKSANQQVLLYSPNPYRSSDHDPVYVDLREDDD